MKKTLTLLTLVLATSLAQADSWSTPNEGGGLIVVTDRPCPDQVKGKGLLEAYATLPNGRVKQGCWAFLDGMVHIAWGAGVLSVLSVDAFSVQDMGKKPEPSARNKSSML